MEPLVESHLMILPLTVSEALTDPAGETLPHDYRRLRQAIAASGRRIVTSTFLATHLRADPSEATIVLCEAGILIPTSITDVWEAADFPCRGWTHGWGDIAAFLAVEPNHPLCVAGPSVLFAHGWLKRPVGTVLGLPPNVALPELFADYAVLRREPRVALHHVDTVPMWRPATLLAHMASRPRRADYTDSGEWLRPLCAAVDIAELHAELAGSPRRTWLAAAFLVWRGGAIAHSEALLSAVPPDGTTGPYDFGQPHRGDPHGAMHDEFETRDHILSRSCHGDDGMRPSSGDTLVPEGIALPMRPLLLCDG